MNDTAPTDTAFQMAASNIRFGVGITREIGMDLKDLAVKRTMVLVDPALVDLPVGHAVLESLQDQGIEYELFRDISIEPTDESFKSAAQFATQGNFDSFVAVGGGSTMDTAKAANLYATHPADFFDYVNAPIGRGLPVPGPLKPLIAVPTTTGTGSETTGVAIFDDRTHHAKTGIAHRYLKPTLGILDVNNTRSLKGVVVAATGLDVLSHALESYTARPYDTRPLPARPLERPAYQGANPVSDIWALRAMEMVNEFLIRAVRDAGDTEARGQMLLAAAMAGIGFGNAGVHLPHGMSYPVAGMVKSFQPDGFDVDHPLVPHGMSVILNTPAVARFTAPASPQRHLQAARALGADAGDAPAEQAGDILANEVVRYMRELNMPNGLSAVGYGEADIPALIEGTLPQHRVTKLSPIEASAGDLESLFRDSLTIW